MTAPFHEFERLGVQILIADMPGHNGKDRKDVLVRQIHEAIAEENRKEIIERLWKGRQERVRQGLPPGGNRAYGYHRNGKGLAVDLAEADTVRTIFELDEWGEARSGIARVLNEKGRGRRNGKPWTPRQIAAILGRRSLYADGLVQYGEANGQDEGLALFSRVVPWAARRDPDST